MRPIFDLDEYTKKLKSVPPTPEEELFLSRYRAAKSAHRPESEKWEKIEARLYNKDWEKETLLTKQGNFLMKTLNWTLSEYNPKSFVPEINAIDIDKTTDGKKYDKVIKSEWQRLGMLDKNIDVIRDSLIYGMGVQRVFYNPKVKFNEKVNGVVQTERISPYHFLFDPRATEIDEADYFIVRKKSTMLGIFSNNEVKNNSELKQKILTNWLNIENSGISEKKTYQYIDYILTRQYDKLLKEIENKEIDVFHYYYRVIDNSGKMIKNIYRKSIYIGNSNPVLIEDMELPFTFFPFAIYWQNKRTNSLFGAPFLEEAYFYQTSIDYYNEATTRVLRTQKFPILMKPENADFDFESLTKESDKLKSGEAVVKVVNYPATARPEDIKFLNVDDAFRGLQELAFQKIAQAKEDLNLTGINTSTDLGSLTTTGAVQSAQSQAAKYYQHSKLEMSRYCKKLVKLILYFVSQYYKEKRGFVYHLDEMRLGFDYTKKKEIVPKAEKIEIKGTDIEMADIEWNVKIDALTKSEQREQATNLLQLFQIAQQYQKNPNSLVNEIDVVEAMDLPNKKQALKRAVLNQYQNKLNVAEKIMAVVRQAVLFQVLDVFKELGKQKTEIIQNEDDAKKLAFVLLNYLKFQGDVEKLWNANESINMGDIVRQVVNLTIIDEKK